LDEVVSSDAIFNPLKGHAVMYLVQIDYIYLFGKSGCEFDFELCCYANSKGARDGEYMINTKKYILPNNGNHNGIVYAFTTFSSIPPSRWIRLQQRPRRELPNFDISNVVGNH
jgi:hypothetical protein